MMHFCISIRSRSDLALDAEHFLTSQEPGKLKDMLVVSHLALQACISFCSFSDKSGALLFSPCSHGNDVAHVYFPRIWVMQRCLAVWPTNVLESKICSWIVQKRANQLCKYLMCHGSQNDYVNNSHGNNSCNCNCNLASKHRLAIISVTVIDALVLWETEAHA